MKTSPVGRCPRRARRSGFRASSAFWLSLTRAANRSRASVWRHAAAAGDAGAMLSAAAPATPRSSSRLLILGSLNSYVPLRIQSATTTASGGWPNRRLRARSGSELSRQSHEVAPSQDVIGRGIGVGLDARRPSARVLIGQVVHARAQDHAVTDFPGAQQIEVVDR